MILVTGGAGFIGANFVLDWIATEKSAVLNLDKLTYAGNVGNLASLKAEERHIFVKGDINDRTLVGNLLNEHRPQAVVHFAAESHVDRSIRGPAEFVQTNIVGTFSLLEETRAYWTSLGDAERRIFRIVHVSTDEVFGTLTKNDPAFTESTAYAPNSPYAASKAASDHLVRAYRHTYGLPTIITNCSNNYGPMQFPEKLIPLMTINALRGEALPVYGDGSNVRDWLYVADHCAAIRLVLKNGLPGETYNIGGSSELSNLDVVRNVCTVLDELRPDEAPHSKLITFVKDRPGHDWRYAMDSRKIQQTLRWQPHENFKTGLKKTIEWYLGHMDWVDKVISGEYRSWIDTNYADRGLA